MKHTPEPWVSHDDDHCPEEIYGALDGPLEAGQMVGELVCTVNMEHERAFANIALIKAAPDLLAALQESDATLKHVLLNAPNYDWNADPLQLTLRTGKSFAQTDAAIAKATK